jgi:hypothetical protein
LDFIDLNQNQFKMIHFIRNNKDIDPKTQDNKILSDNDKIYFVTPMEADEIRFFLIIIII